MRHLVAVLLAISMFSALVAPLQARAGYDDPMEFHIRHQDQQLHILASYAIAFTFTEMLEATKLSRPLSVLIASALTMAIGTYKEWKLDDRFSRGDEIANAIGTGASAVMVLTFRL